MRRRKVGIGRKLRGQSKSENSAQLLTFFCMQIQQVQIQIRLNLTFPASISAFHIPYLFASLGFFQMQRNQQGFFFLGTPVGLGEAGQYRKRPLFGTRVGCGKDGYRIIELGR